MNKKDFNKKLKNELCEKDVSLPQSLSAENIEKLINENGGIMDAKPPRLHNRKKVAKIIVSVAASIAVVVGAGLAVNSNREKIELKKQDSVIAEKTEKSDYGKIETAVLKYYKDNVYNLNKQSNSLSNKLSSAFNSVIGNKSEDKAESDMVTGNAAAGAADNQSDNYSQTNTQVEGVDEGDLVKNDGKYIYYVKGNEVIIADTQKPDNMNIVSRIVPSKEANDIVNEIYLYNDSLVVIWSKTNISPDESGDSTSDGYMTSYCYDAMYNSDTVITVYGLKDKSNVTTDYSVKVDGSYVSSRITNGRLIAVTSFSIPYSYEENNFDSSCDKIKENCIPSYSINGGADRKIDSENIYMPDETDVREYSVTLFKDLKESDSEPQLTATLGVNWQVYCTNDSLFVASLKTNYIEDATTYSDKAEISIADVSSFSENTVIYKYDISDSGIKYSCSGSVVGEWLNQFSMDYYNGYFRIVTTNFKGDSGTMTNIVTVLDENMKQVGILEGIAKGESVYAARFLGNTLYVVTYYQTDPLFVIDLSDPANPVVKGEVKLPGFSSYLHPIGNNLVLGVGVGGNDSGTDGSAKISLFDVSDPVNPKEIDNYTVSDAYFNSDHKEFLKIDNDTFGINLSKYRYYNQSYDSVNICKLMMFDISENGITLKNEFPMMNDSDIYYCRGAFTGNTMFTVDYSGIISYNMTTGEKISELSF